MLKLSPLRIPDEGDDILQSCDLQSLDARLGKFAVIQQQHDDRLAEIGRRLGTLEVLITDLRTEGHRERESLRTELLGKIDAVEGKINAKVEALRSEFNARLEKLNDKIDSQYK